MAEKTLNARIQMKTDTEANWLNVTNFIPKKGEIIIYEADTTHNYQRVKIGNGTKKVNELPFVIDYMTGSTSTSAGKAGLVPTPGAGANLKYLRGDGTWQDVSAITNAEIDEICGATIYDQSEVQV